MTSREEHLSRQKKLIRNYVELAQDYAVHHPESWQTHDDKEVFTMDFLYTESLTKSAAKWALKEFSGKDTFNLVSIISGEIFKADGNAQIIRMEFII